LAFGGSQSSGRLAFAGATGYGAAMKAFEDLRSLPIAERIQLVEDLWDSIAEDSGGFQLTEAQREELDRRMDDFDSNPAAGTPWEEMKRSIVREP
jgi:putative addiction module component (TIGR02574 family)